MRGLIYEDDFKRIEDIQDITRVLSSISPGDNVLQDIVLDANAYGPVPWSSPRNQAWAALAKEITRISSHGRALKLDLTILMNGPGPHTRQDGVILSSYLDGILEAEFSPLKHVKYKAP
jgi:hypothetical protein